MRREVKSEKKSFFSQHEQSVKLLCDIRTVCTPIESYCYLYYSYVCQTENQKKDDQPQRQRRRRERRQQQQSKMPNT